MSSDNVKSPRGPGRPRKYRKETVTKISVSTLAIIRNGAARRGLSPSEYLDEIAAPAALADISSRSSS